MKRGIALLERKVNSIKRPKVTTNAKKKKSLRRAGTWPCGIWVWGTGEVGGEVWEEAGRRG